MNQTISYSKQILNQTAQVTLSVRQLTDNEYTSYCPNHINNYKHQYPPKMNPSKYNQSDFYLKIVTSGCYYMDENTTMWSSNGLEILENSNSTHTFCQSNHLTKFAGGWIVLPPSIDFDYAFANVSFSRNPTVYITVISIVCLYVIFSLGCIYMDKKDEEKIGVCLLPSANTDTDSFKENKYIYEIVLFTGLSFDSGTNSNVF
jgi:hypothetical protein